MNNELFTIKPNLRQIYGRTVTKEMEFDEYTENKEIHQTLKDLVLTTEVNKSSEYEGIKVEEHSQIKLNIPEGTILLWSEEDGYTIPQTKVYKLKDLEKELEQIKEVYKDNTDVNPKE